MDLDALTRSRWPSWQRLAELGNSRALTGQQTDELISRYQSAAGDLSDLRTAYGSTREADVLSLRLAKARQKFTGTGANVLVTFIRFFSRQLPAALYRLRWWTLGSALYTVVVAVLTSAWVLTQPEILAYLGSEAELKKYAENDFINYYSEFSESSFAAKVFTNNAWIAAQCILLGITGLWVPYVLMQNGVSLGISAAVLASVGHLDTFFLWIAPHGLLELTMVFVAGAAGLKLFWSWVSPGNRKRLDALAQEGRSLFIVAIGTTIFLFISGIIEGYVTRQPWPWSIKIGIGVIALALYLVYALWVGRRAAKDEETGDLVEFEAGARIVTAD